jgi:hypothetical protein
VQTGGSLPTLSPFRSALDGAPTLLSGVFNVAAATLTLTFDQTIDAGTIGLSDITINDSSSETWESITTPITAGAVVVVDMAYVGNIGTPALRCSYDGSSAGFTYAAGTPMNAWTNFTITEV